MVLNYRGKYTALKIFSLSHFSKTTKNSCRLTLLTDSFRQLDQNLSVDSFVLLFEVHITFEFQSEVPPLFFFLLGEFGRIYIGELIDNTSKCIIKTLEDEKSKQDYSREIESIKKTKLFFFF